MAINHPFQKDVVVFVLICCTNNHDLVPKKAFTFELKKKKERKVWIFVNNFRLNEGSYSAGVNSKAAEM